MLVLVLLLVPAQIIAYAWSTPACLGACFRNQHPTQPTKAPPTKGRPPTSRCFARQKRPRDLGTHRHTTQHTDTHEREGPTSQAPAFSRARATATLKRGRPTRAARGSPSQVGSPAPITSLSRRPRCPPATRLCVRAPSSAHQDDARQT